MFKLLLIAKREVSFNANRIDLIQRIDYESTCLSDQAKITFFEELVKETKKR
jgi:hypothetical protein